MAKRKLYTVTHRPSGGKWATVQIFTIQGGELTYTTSARFQPGASAGHAHECRRAYDAWGSTDAATMNRWEVREIDHTL